MGRLKADFLERVENLCDRILDVADYLEQQGRSRRVVDQITGAGSSVGANCFEADEALSRADFCKCVGISIKELNESRFWLRMGIRRSWAKKERLQPLLAEAEEIKKIMGAILNKSRRATR